MLRNLMMVYSVFKFVLVKIKKNSGLNCLKFKLFVNLDFYKFKIKNSKFKIKSI